MYVCIAFNTEGTCFGTGRIWNTIYLKIQQCILASSVVVVEGLEIFPWIDLVLISVTIACLSLQSLEKKVLIGLEIELVISQKSKNLFPWFQLDARPNCLLRMTGFVDILHYSVCLPTTLCCTLSLVRCFELLCAAFAVSFWD